MYNNGDPEKEVAKADATSVTTSRYYPRLDQPLESSNNLFNNKGALEGAKLGLVPGKYKRTKTPLPKSYYTMKKEKTSIKRPKK